VLHTPPILRAGDRVSARVAVARDLRGQVSRPVRALHAMGSSGGPGSPPFARTEATLTRAQLAWQSGCALLSFDEAGTSHIEGDLEFEEMERVLGRWREDVQSCSYFSVRYDGRIASEVGPATEEEPEDCHAPNAAALTTLHFIDDPDSDRNGTLLDADVEMNGVNFAIAVDHQTTSVSGCESDLANTFTHEIGHLMGLDHTCWSGTGTQLDDDQGEPLPRCSLDLALPPEVRDATMYASQECGETKKATPEPDDIDGICAIYPIEDDPNECSSAEINPGGCRAVTGTRRETRGTGAAALVTLAGVALLFRRRRRRG
jgi:hypothetical protein